MKTRTLIVIAIIGASSIAAYDFGLRTRPGSIALPNQSSAKEPYQVIDGLAVQTSKLDLGQVWEQKDFAYELPIENHTSRDLEIVDFALSCGCLGIEPRHLSVPANGTATVRLKVDLTQRSLRDLGRASRPVDLEITPLQKNGWPRGSGWNLHGVVNSRVVLDTFAVDFGELPVHNQPCAPTKVLATVHVPMQKLVASVDPKVAMVQIHPRPEGPDRFDLLITPRETLPPGSFECKSKLDLVAPDGQHLPGVTLPISGRMQPEIRVLPARLLLGSRPIGELAVAEVVLQAPPQREVLVDLIEIDSGDVHIEPVVIEGLQPGRTFRVNQRVTMIGDHTSVARFLIRNSGKPPVPVSMEICYRGELAAATQENTNQRRGP
jgi:hypothetical protein